ncbi:MAG: PilZ domain-containing protein [Firmicutes bacterium]|jgi:hypothetical protein|nr:PilZ domain-containing protein [Bacillota bacterium]MCL5065663.1 PilZ domain-containing protein [Bacillota bacterium]
MTIEMVMGKRLVRTRVLRVLGRDVYLEALPDIESELTPLPGQAFEMVWMDDETRWSQSARMKDVLETLPIMLVNLEGKARVSDKRQVPRVRVTVPVEYGIPHRERYLTTTLDLSVAGLRFPSVIPLWVELDLSLVLRLGPETLSVRAKVVRADKTAKDFRGRQGWETAVRFLSLGYRERGILEQFVRSHLKPKVSRG